MQQNKDIPELTERVVPEMPKEPKPPVINGFIHPHTDITWVMTHEDCRSQLAFMREIVADLRPKGALERQFARTVALDQWRLNRIKAIEENIFAYGQVVPTRDIVSNVPLVENALRHAWTYREQSKILDRLSLYESRLTRTIARNIELLLRLQVLREKREQLERETQPTPIDHALTQTATASTAAAPKPETLPKAA